MDTYEEQARQLAAIIIAKMSVNEPNAFEMARQTLLRVGLTGLLPNIGLSAEPIYKQYQATRKELGDGPAWVKAILDNA